MVLDRIFPTESMIFKVTGKSRILPLMLVRKVVAKQGGDVNGKADARSRWNTPVRTSFPVAVSRMAESEKTIAGNNVGRTADVSP